MKITPEILRLLRLSKRMTVRQFAEEVGCSFSLISKLELSRVPITMRVENKIRQAFELTDEKIERLLRIEDDLSM